MAQTSALALILALALAGSASAHDCKCRANGAVFTQGQLVCIRGKLARCDMLLNNSSWKVVADICPQAALAPAPLPHSEKPARHT